MTDNTKVVRYGRDKLAQHEAPAAADTLAGHLVEEVAGGVQPHSTDGGNLDRVLVALDARGRGKEVGSTYDAAADENTPYGNCNAGVGLTLLVAVGASVPEGDRLVSAGDGTVRAFDGAGGDVDNDVVGVAEEPVDNTGGSAPLGLAAEVTR